MAVDSFLCCSNAFNVQLIVDNFSNNGSIEGLLNKYANSEIIEFVKMERNYGFAKANDAGYLVAKHMYDYDIIIIMNNDVMIEDNLFCMKVSTKYGSSKCGIVGPDIINMEGFHQNPLINCLTKYNEIRKTIIKNKIKLLLMPLFYRCKKNKKTIKNNQFLEVKEGTPLHGSCLIFTNEFIRSHEYPFYPNTFLYGEEELLYYFANCEGVKTIYDPELMVHHMEDAATNDVIKNSASKRRFELENSNKSLLMLKNLMQQGMREK